MNKKPVKLSAILLAMGLVMISPVVATNAPIAQETAPKDTSDKLNPASYEKNLPIDTAQSSPVANAEPSANVGGLANPSFLAELENATQGEGYESLNSENGSLQNLTPYQMVAHIGAKRFSNVDWQAKIVKLNVQGMMIERLMMEAESNFLKQQTYNLESRVELLLATLVQAHLKPMDDKIQDIAVSVDAEFNADIIDVPVEYLQAQGIGWNGVIGGITDIALSADWDSVNKENIQEVIGFMVQKVLPSHEAQTPNGYNYYDANDKLHSYPFEPKASTSIIGHNNGTYTKPITQYTVGELLAKSRYKKGVPSIHAHGYFQMLGVGLEEVGKKYQADTGINTFAQPFTEEFQRDFGGYWALNKRSEIIRWFKNGAKYSEIGRASNAYAHEWSSVLICKEQGGTWVSSGRGAYKEKAKTDICPMLVAISAWYQKNGKEAIAWQGKNGRLGHYKNAQIKTPTGASIKAPNTNS